MLRGLLIQIWMCYQRNGLTISGMSIRAYTRQIPTLKKKKTSRYRQKFNRPPDQIMYGQKYGRKLVKSLGIEKKQEWAKEEPKLDNARKLRGIYLLDPDAAKNQKISKAQEENWKDLWHHPCHAKGWFIRASRK